MKKKVSIRDIARQLDVSATAVSFVLNGKAEEQKISQKLEQRILSHVKKTGYRPNQIAQSLRTGKSMIIGMLVEDISDPFFSSIARIVEDNLYKKGYKIFHSSTDNNTEKAKELLRIFHERQVDGYIIAPAPETETEISELLQESKPVIVFDRFFPGVPTTNVIVDNKEGAYKATRHLVENGFASIALVTLNSEQGQMKDRLKGYNKAIKEAGFVKRCLKIHYKTAPEEITELVKKFIMEDKTDAILFATNYLAVSGIKAIQELGLHIPHDIGVVGFDDNTNFALFSPSITAVSQPVKAISENVTTLLLGLLSGDGKLNKPQTIILSTDLIIRKSSIKS
ncbi:MAG: LacI family DNA-binding transcriptional regulator [Chitinophagaceae bacterium]|nr:LacI family DNA-binding transcriptional regulator [Chitinophagaceae bacterium]